MEKDKELTLKQKYKQQVLSHISDTVTICNIYKHCIPQDIQDTFARLKKDAEEVVTKILKSDDESWKT